jgi:hypothetical protein
MEQIFGIMQAMIYIIITISQTIGGKLMWSVGKCKIK